MKISYIFSDTPKIYYFEDFEINNQSTKNVAFSQYCKIVSRNGKYFIIVSKKGRLVDITHIVDIADNRIVTSEIEIDKYYLILIPDDNYEKLGKINPNSKFMIMRIIEKDDTDANYFKNVDQYRIKQAFTLYYNALNNYYRRIKSGKI